MAFLLPSLCFLSLFMFMFSFFKYFLKYSRICELNLLLVSIMIKGLLFLTFFFFFVFFPPFWEAIFGLKFPQVLMNRNSLIWFERYHQHVKKKKKKPEVSFQRKTNWLFKINIELRENALRVRIYWIIVFYSNPSRNVIPKIICYKRRYQIFCKLEKTLHQIY